MNKLLSYIAIAAISLSVGGTASAATTNGIANGLLTANPDSWFFNFTKKNNHHIATGGSANSDFTVNAGSGGLNYSDPVRQGSSSLPNPTGITLNVLGFSGFSFDAQAGTISGTEEQIRHDFAGSSDHNGIGVMSEGSNSLEQVNTNNDEFLRLSFSQAITLSGLDFSNGGHSTCGSNKNCGTFEIFALTGGAFVLAGSGDLSTADFVSFSGISSDTFVIRAANDAGSTGEQGWYLSAIGGDVAAVPLPASILFMIAGLAGLGALKMRRTA